MRLGACGAVGRRAGRGVPPLSATTCWCELCDSQPPGGMKHSAGCCPPQQPPIKAETKEKRSAGWGGAWSRRGLSRVRITARHYSEPLTLLGGV